MGWYDTIFFIGMAVLTVAGIVWAGMAEPVGEKGKPEPSPAHKLYSSSGKLIDMNRPSPLSDRIIDWRSTNKFKRELKMAIQRSQGRVGCLIHSAGHYVGKIIDGDFLGYDETVSIYILNIRKYMK